MPDEQNPKIFYFSNNNEGVMDMHTAGTKTLQVQTNGYFITTAIKIHSDYKTSLRHTISLVPVLYHEFCAP
jgi:hypothetical protein